ncbi:MAG: TetR family transcriptional regulator [Bacteroidetes bacterium]|nr:TetR family transcriptional regulator [Bacteroidota bacterium]
MNRKEQIRVTAQNLFRERGYPATSMRDLAAQIGIEPASLYSHIDSKEAILQGICFEIADEFFKTIEPVMNANIPADQKLMEAIRNHVKVIKHNSDAFAVFLNDWRYLSEPSLSEFKRQRKHYEDMFKDIIGDGMKQGIFKHMNVKFTVLTLFSSLNWIYLWYKPSGEMTPMEIADNLGALILNGLKTK